MKGMENSFLDTEHNLPTCPSYELQYDLGIHSLIIHLTVKDATLYTVPNSPQGEDFHLFSSRDRSELRKHRSRHGMGEVASS